MRWQIFDKSIGRLWQFLNAVQLLIAICVFLWYGWEQKKIDADTQRTDIELRKAEFDTLAVAIGALKKSDSYLIGSEVLKIIFSPDRECLTEDQYMVIDFLAELYNKTADLPVPRETFLAVMKKRPACLKQDPIVVSTATNGYLVVGTPKFSCIQCTGRRVVDFSNFSVVFGLERATLIGGLESGAIIKAKIDINLRTNTTDIETGNNPVLRTISAGQCASVKESFPQLRGNTWAAVTLRDCL